MFYCGRKSTPTDTWCASSMILDTFTTCRKNVGNNILTHRVKFSKLLTVCAALSKSSTAIILSPLASMRALAFFWRFPAWTFNMIHNNSFICTCTWDDVTTTTGAWSESNGRMIYSHSIVHVRSVEQLLVQLLGNVYLKFHKVAMETDLTKQLSPETFSSFLVYWAMGCMRCRLDCGISIGLETLFCLLV